MGASSLSHWEQVARRDADLFVRYNRGPPAAGALWERNPRVAAPQHARTTDRLTRLRRAGAEIMDLASHGKILVCDDWAIVSSYNFLSADPGLRSAHELGLQVFDAAIVEQLWEFLTADSPR